MIPVANHRRKFARNLPGVYLLIAWLIILMLQPVAAQDAVTPRIQIGLSLFPSVVAADRNLANQVDASQRLNLYVVYGANDSLAQRLQEKLSKLPSIRNFKVNAESISVADLLNKTGPMKGALFLAEPAGDDIESLIQFSQKNRILIFSSFKGDVELGVASGYQVTNKVLPLVNMKSLKQSNIDLKAFFLRIAVKYE